MGNRRNRTDIFAFHASNITRGIYGNSVKRSNEIGALWADRDTGATLNASIPTYLEIDSRFTHLYLDFFVFGIRTKVRRHSFEQALVALLNILEFKDACLFSVEFPHLIPKLFKPDILISF